MYGLSNSLGESKKLVDIIDYIEKFRNEMNLNIGELKPNTKQPKTVDGKIPHHNEINENDIDVKDGLCVFCGKTSLNLMILDLDDESLIDDFKDYLQKTFVVKSGKKGYHIYFRTYDNPKSRSLTNTKGQHIDILGQGKIAVLPPSIHIDTKKPYEIISDNKIKQLTRIEEQGLFQKLLGLGFSISDDQKSVIELHDKDFVKTKGENGGLDLLRVIASWKVKNPELSESIILTMAHAYTNEHHDPPCTDNKVKSLVKQSYGYGEQILSERVIEENQPSRKAVDIYEISKQLMEEYTFVTLEKTKEILFYKDGIYQDDGDNIISKRTRKIQYGIKLNHITEIKGIIKDETGYVSHDEFDKEEYKVNLKNCIFNFKTGEHIDHTPDYLSRVKIPVFYNPDAKCPRFDKFLETSLDNDEQKIRTVLEMMALCMIKDNSLVQKAFMNTGKGSNGKSVLFSILVTLLGKLNVSAKTIHDFEKNHFASSSLEGKLANICADVGNKGIDSTEALKKLIGGDPVDCERKFMEGYTFTPYATLIFSANDIPEVSDESDGFARRFELIEWEKSFYGKDRDNTVKTIRKDPTELSGIFNKLSVIAKELLQTHALRYESTVEDAKILWLKKSDSTQRFLKENCAINPDYLCPVAEIFGNYTKFAKELGMTPLNDRKFNAKLEKQGLSRSTRRINGVSMKVWTGVTLSSKLVGDNQMIA